MRMLRVSTQAGHGAHRSAGIPACGWDEHPCSVNHSPGLPQGCALGVAFLPQFLISSEPLLPQMVLFEVTFLVLATINAASYALIAAGARRTIRKPSVQRIVNRTGGGLLVGAGVLAAGWRKAA